MAHIKTAIKVDVEGGRTRVGRGLVEAECMTGVIYKSEEYADMGFDKAMNWSLKVAEMNFPPVLDNIGYMYHFGEGVPKDEVRASERYRMAAEQGHTNAQCNLGNLYKDGDGVPKDSIKAVEWFLKSTEPEYTMGQVSLGTPYCKGQGVGRNLEQVRR
ncbi:hypothetical protein EC957_002900 [Mortierella hygrophila]|uniref:Uncharacterized protein n=1 Tax=Mortierella hygrophila TaxID=979708 RepID=A0A9P6F2X4_9FUNG|nr:hypothetical protein EC957_002900 [Mortierella hygrophila]